MIPIFKPYMPVNIEEGLNEILYSGKLSFGKYGKEFERKLVDFTGSKNILSVSTYNHAMLIVLSTLGLKPGDEVIASPVSCLASNQPFVIKGLRIIWGDVNPKTGSLCIDDVRSKITKKTKAIFHNHYCGYLGSIEEMNELGREYGIPVIDDCIEAFGSELNGKKTGNLGTDITVFSFQTVRLPNTIDGGALAFNDKALFEKAKLIRDQGIDRTYFRDELNEINPLCDINLEGYGGLMSEINSFIGLRQMDQIDSLLKKQRDNAELWNRRINEISDEISLPKKQDSIPNFWVYGVLAKNRTESIKAYREQGLYATSVHINNNRYSVFKNNIDLKGVNEFMNHFVAIPCGWWVNLNTDE